MYNHAFYKEVLDSIAQCMGEAETYGDDSYYHFCAEKYVLVLQKIHLERCHEQPSALNSADQRRLCPETDQRPKDSTPSCDDFGWIYGDYPSPMAPDDGDWEGFP